MLQTPQGNKGANAGASAGDMAVFIAGATILFAGISFCLVSMFVVSFGSWQSALGFLGVGIVLTGLGLAAVICMRKKVNRAE